MKVASSGRQLRGERRDQIEPLLVHHARHHADDGPRHGGVIRREPEQLEQRALRLPLPLEPLHIERRRQKRIVRRVPLVDVDAVENADQRIGSRSHHAVEAIAVLGTLNFIRIGRTDRRHRVGEFHARLEQAEAIPELEAIDVEIVPAQTESRHPCLLDVP